MTREEAESTASVEALEHLVLLLYTSSLPSPTYPHTIIFNSLSVFELPEVRPEMAGFDGSGQVI